MKLLEIPRPEWQDEYNAIMKDSYLSKKYNRERRIRDHRKFISDYMPELKHCTDKNVFDIGCGMGESLEILKEIGHDPVGIDANPVNVCEMGRNYVKMAMLMAERQKLKIDFVGFKKWLYDYKHPENWFYYIFMRGSIEQCFSHHMTGPPHWQTKNAGALSWNITDKLWKEFELFFSVIERLLEDGGYMVIHANGAKNSPKYDDLVLETLKKFPTLQLYKKSGKTFHKIRKMV